VSNNTMLYYLSTIAQSMAALFAVGGIFAIYRLQEINTEITNTCRAFKEYLRRLIEFSPQGLVKMTEKKIAER